MAEHIFGAAVSSEEGAKMMELVDQLVALAESGVAALGHAPRCAALALHNACLTAGTKHQEQEAVRTLGRMMIESGAYLLGINLRVEVVTGEKSSAEDVGMLQ